jgi:starch phosphorylase
LKDLEELSRNLWWSEHPEGRELWELVSAGVAPSRSKEALERNPVALLRALGPRDLKKLASSSAYLSQHESVMARYRDDLSSRPPARGFSYQAPIAYFSMEFGVHESLPIYAGGLGILAGDHVKSASDERLPLVGVGLFYHNGYFRQELDKKGRQRVIYPKADPRTLPIEAARGPSGRELRVKVEFPDHDVSARVWRVRVGRVDLLLLDTDIPENKKADRFITYRLYGGSREDRIRQEVLVGIGGVRALRALRIHPSVWHLNEGHVAFLTLERLREVEREQKLKPAEALELVAASTVFTTHTPVPEGNEAFDLALAGRYLRRHAEAAGTPLEEYLALGLDRAKDGRPFLSMTVLALRLSRFRNGVSRLHGEVSRKMWSHLWPGFRAEDVPITHVTNGIHTTSWAATEMDALLRRRVGEDWSRRLDDERFWKRTSRLPEHELWRVKQELKAEMVRFVRERENARLERHGWSAAKRRKLVEGLLDPEVFTLGWARRFALYKRAALLFRDLERVRKLFASRSRPVQMVFAGKPHPEDAQGKAVFENVAAISRMKEFQGKVILLENYDIEVARRLVQGVDLWLNNPRRPLEASGTSGQKVPINAGLNLSILDGWWCEGSAPDTGWAFGKPMEYSDPALQDKEDAEALYRVLEREVIPLYYRRDRSGVPLGWFQKAKSSMAKLVPRFSTAHMVGEYARRLYLPAIQNGRQARASGAKGARELAAWRERVLRSWPFVHVRSVGPRKGSSVAVEVFLSEIRPEEMACRDDDGVDHDVHVEAHLGPGVHRLAVHGAGSGRNRQASRVLRLYPRHRLLVHPRELGLSIAVTIAAKI